MFRILIALLLMSSAALAQSDGVTVNPPITISSTPIIEALLPYVLAGAGGLITVAFGIMATWLKRKWNIDIEAHHREAWQTAAQNAAAALIAKGAAKIGESGKITMSDTMLASAAKTVMEQAVPDAIKHFGLTEEQVRQAIIAKVPQILTGATPAALVTERKTT